MTLTATSATALRSTTALPQLQDVRSQEKSAPQAQAQAQAQVTLQPAVMRMEASAEAVAQSRSKASAFDAAAQAHFMRGVFMPNGLGNLEGLQMVHHRPGHNPSITAPPPGFPGGNPGLPTQPQLPPQRPSQPQNPSLPQNPQQPRRGLPGLSV
jgi:hypothetical protein